MYFFTQVAQQIFSQVLSTFAWHIIKTFLIICIKADQFKTRSVGKKRGATERQINCDQINN